MSNSDSSTNGKPSRPSSSKNSSKPKRASQYRVDPATGEVLPLRPIDDSPAAKYLPEGKWFKLPNFAAEHLQDDMSFPLWKGYVFIHYLASQNGVNGEFFCSGQTMAHGIGCEDPRFGRRILERFLDAGLITLRWRGRVRQGKNYSSRYRLIDPATLNLKTLRTVLRRPLNPPKARAGLPDPTNKNAAVCRGNTAQSYIVGSARPETQGWYDEQGR